MGGGHPEVVELSKVALGSKVARFWGPWGTSGGQVSQGDQVNQEHQGAQLRARPGCQSCAGFTKVTNRRVPPHSETRGTLWGQPPPAPTQRGCPAPRGTNLWRGENKNKVRPSGAPPQRGCPAPTRGGNHIGIPGAPRKTRSPPRSATPPQVNIPKPR